MAFVFGHQILIWPGALEQSPNELSLTLPLDENVQYLRVAWICKFIVPISLLFPAEQQQKQLFFLKIVFKFWCVQLTFDIFNWVYSKHMIHYNKVNWKIFAKNFLKIFPIDFQSPIDFSQLHMIRPLLYENVEMYADELVIIFVQNLGII